MRTRTIEDEAFTVAFSRRKAYVFLSLVLHVMITSFYSFDDVRLPCGGMSMSSRTFIALD